MEYLSDLMLSAGTSANVEAHARLVAKAARVRDIRAGALAVLQANASLAPEDMAQVVRKARAASGADNIMVCERGASFGYNNLVSDMRALSVMRPSKVSTRTMSPMRMLRSASMTKPLT